MGPMDPSLERPASPARLPYTSDKHPRHTLEAINVLRKHRELCDVVLIVGQRKIFAHRVILSACSPYFHAMFTGELAESRQTEVTIRDIDENAMELLIDFCYTSSITVRGIVIVLAQTGKTGEHFLVREKSGNFAKTGKVGILPKILEKIRKIILENWKKKKNTGKVSEFC